MSFQDPANGPQQQETHPDVASAPTLSWDDAAPAGTPPQGHVDVATAAAADVLVRDSNALFAITANVDRLEDLAAVLGTPRDSAAVRTAVADITSEIARAITHQESLLTRARAVDPNSTHNRVQYQRLEAGFNDVLHRFQAVSRVITDKTKVDPPSGPHKQQADALLRANKYGADAIASRHARNTIGGQSNVRGFGENGGSTYTGDDDDDEGDDTNGENTALLTGIQTLESRNALSEEVRFNSQLIEQRDADLRGIERAVIEVNEIFRDLGSLVQEQQGLLDNIETNVETADTNLEKANRELDKAIEHQKNSRNRMCWILIILLVLIFFLVLIAAV